MMDRFLHIINQFKENILILIGLFVTFLTPIHGMLLTTGSFIMIDTLFAIYVAVKLGGWDAFKSSKLWNFAPKSFFYLVGVMMGFLVDTYIVAGTLWGINLLITKIVCFFFIYVEIKSIDETSMKLGNKSLWTVIKELIVKAKGIKKDLNEIVEDKDGSDNP